VNMLLAPHHDDETLFAAYTCLRHRPTVVVCTEAHRLEYADFDVRKAECHAATTVLGVRMMQLWGVRDDDLFDNERLLSELRLLDRDATIGRVWAPAVEHKGNDHHNAVGEAAAAVFGGRVTSYLTYANGKRSCSTAEVPFHPSWPAVKLRALACYESQVAHPATAPWFIDNTLREWYADTDAP
jgi:LmbE family N-acetylglucosaminyl deacetylase